MSQRRNAILIICGALLASAGLIDTPANAQKRLEAQYRITMTGVPVGKIIWQVEFANNLYTMSASGGANGVVSLLINGQGLITTNGKIVDGHLAPTNFISNIIDDDGKTELQVSFFDNVAKELVVRGPKKKPLLTPVNDDDRRGVTDPLSAMLMSSTAQGAIDSKTCNQTLPIFDGQRRYNLLLTYKRMDRVKIDQSYSGPALVCSVTLQPIGGYRVGSMIVKYVAHRRDIELWFAPIAGMSIVAPVQLSVPTLIGTMNIQAERFEASGSR